MRTSIQQMNTRNPSEHIVLPHRCLHRAGHRGRLQGLLKFEEAVELSAVRTLDFAAIKLLESMRQHSKGTKDMQYSILSIGHISRTICCPSFSCWSRWCCHTNSRSSITCKVERAGSGEFNCLLKLWKSLETSSMTGAVEAAVREYYVALADFLDLFVVLKSALVCVSYSSRS
jgi:hypothetical protein